MKTKTNKQIKRMIASVTASEWVRMYMVVSISCGSLSQKTTFFTGLSKQVSAVKVRYGKPVSIKESEVK